MNHKLINRFGKWKWILPATVVLVVISIAAYFIRGAADVNKDDDLSIVQTPVLPTGFFAESVVSGLDLLVAVDWAPDGRMFIAEKSGVVRVFKNGALLPTPFIDISSQVNNANDRGLLGIAVHPDFPTPPYVYLLFTYDPPELKGLKRRARPDREGNRVSRLIRVAADVNKGYDIAIPESEEVLLGKNSTFQNIGDPGGNRTSRLCCDDNGTPIEDCLPIDENTHTIGTVAFGTDGSLFVSNGDGSYHGRVGPTTLRAQDLNSLAGKILRIHPLTGDAYPDNPFFDGSFRSNQSKVYNYGLRNPFRFAIDPSDNEPYIGEVGWETWEEINTGRGANFGWPCYEGGDKVNVRQEGYSHYQTCRDLYENENAAKPPIYAWYRAGTGAASVGGDFYGGDTYPAEYRGAFFFGDYVNGWTGI